MIYKTLNTIDLEEIFIIKTNRYYEILQKIKLLREDNRAAICKTQFKDNVEYNNDYTTLKDDIKKAEKIL